MAKKLTKSSESVTYVHAFNMKTSAFYKILQILQHAMIMILKKDNIF